MNTQLLIEKAKKAGIDPIEIYIQKAKKESMNVYEQKVDSFTIAQSGGIAIRGVYNEKLGYCFLEEDNDENIDLCIQMIQSNASAIESDDPVLIYGGSEEYPLIQMSPVKEISTANKIAFLKETESKLQKSNPRIKQVMQSELEVQSVEIRIVNSLGMDISKSEEYCVYYSAVLANENDENKSAYEIRCTHDLSGVDLSEYVETLTNKVTSKLNAKQVKSGKYKVILKNEAMSSLLGSLTGLFNGENVYKGISQLKDKVGQSVFDEKVTIIDDPLKKDGFSSTPFDDEGVASKRKVIVENGVLKMFLHNQKSASMMNEETTGNGFKSGYASSIGIRPTNFYIQVGSNSYEELLKEMGNGIIIDELNGLHAGLNPISTDFSLQASGYYVEEGKIVYPIHLITVAGNFLEMMKHIESVGDDLYESLSGIGSPSILFGELSISGE